MAAQQSTSVAPEQLGRPLTQEEDGALTRVTRAVWDLLVDVERREAARAGSAPRAGGPEKASRGMAV